jgi:ubiquinone/menaquinone biosynthesis C-methylase UbiE
MSNPADPMTDGTSGKPALAPSANVKIQTFVKEAMRSADELYWYASMDEMARSASAAANPGMPAQVLDIGYNTGRSTVWLMLATGAAMVHVVDVTRKHVPSLRRLIREINPEAGVRPVQASVSFLPYRENLFDAVCCRSVLQYVEMEKAILEIRRVLKLDGRGYLIVNMADNPLVNIYRKGTIKQRSASFGSIRGYISYRMLRNWERDGWCVAHKEYHLFAPLLFPVIDRVPIALVKRMLFYTAVFFDVAVIKIFPFLRRFSWLAFVEIRK